MNAQRATATEKATENNVVVFGVQFGDKQREQFEREFTNVAGTPREKLLKYLNKVSETAERVRASVVNMVVLPELRSEVLKWPTDRKEMAEEVFDTSEVGKEINSRIEQMSADEKQGGDAGKASTWRSRRNFIIGNMVKARLVAAKIKEAEDAKWYVHVEHNNPRIHVAHSSTPLKRREYNATALSGVATFIGITDPKKLKSVNRDTNDRGQKIEFKTAAAAMPYVVALSGKFAQWANDPKANGISEEFVKQLSLMVINAHELLAMPLTASQKSKLDELADVDADEDESEAATA